MTMTKKKHKTPERLLIEPEEKELAKTNNIVHQSIAYYIAFIEENSEVKISCREILNEIIMQASPFS